MYEREKNNQKYFSFLVFLAILETQNNSSGFDETNPQELYFCLRGTREAMFSPMADNSPGLFLILGLRRIIFDLIKGCVDDSGERKKVVLKCGNVRRKRHVNANDLSRITQ